MSKAFLPKFLAFVMLLFVGILVASAIIARQANPVILDEKGNVRGTGRPPAAY